MKLIDALLNVDRSPENSNECYYNILSEFCSQLNISPDVYGDYPERDRRFRQHPLREWICTDTWVGLHAYYLDDEPIAISFQPARKCDAEIEFISKEAAHKLRDFLLNFQAEDDDRISLIDDQEIGDDFNVSYSSQLLTDKGFYDGKPVKVVAKKPNSPKSAEWSWLKVEFEDGTRKEINIKDFRIPYNVKAV